MQEVSYKNGNLNLVAAYEETTWGKKVLAAKGTTQARKSPQSAEVIVSNR